MMPRKFQSEQFFQASKHEPIRLVVTQSEQAAVIAWHFELGQQIPSHLYPNGQDTWTI